MWEFVKDHSPLELLITPEKAFVTSAQLKKIDDYLFSVPTSPSLGRIWRDKHRICWVIPDPDDRPENPDFVLHRKVPYEVVDGAEAIAYLRRLMGLDASSVLVNTAPPPEYGGQRTVDKTDDTPTPRNTLITVTFTFPGEEMGTAIMAAYDALAVVTHKFKPINISANLQLVED